MTLLTVKKCHFVSCFFSVQMATESHCRTVVYFQQSSLVEGDIGLAAILIPMLFVSYYFQVGSYMSKFMQTRGYFSIAS